jgi:hypothetical protein
MARYISPEQRLIELGIEELGPRQVEPTLLETMAVVDSPLLLYPALDEQEPYPVDALGPLADAARAIALEVQAAPCVAAQSVLAVASLAAQALADVVLPIGTEGQARPLSLYLVTVAPSGDRKTSADHEALRPVRMREKAMRDIYDREHEAWRVAHTAWKGQVSSVEHKKNLDLDARRSELAAIGPEPSEPIRPILTAPDPTIEGLACAWPQLPGSLGLFTSEGGQLTGGFGFGPDHRLKTGAALSTLWDGMGLRRVRAIDGVTDLRGRRLALHLMIQPDVALDFLGDEVLRGQGLLSRILVAAPVSIAGTRMFKEPDLDCTSAIRSYTGCLLRLFEAWPIGHDRANELEPRHLPLSDQARRMWIAFYNRVEAEMRPEQLFEELRDVASKAAEQAARIAGILTMVIDPAAREIAGETLNNAETLMIWYLNEALRLARSLRLPPKLKDAQLMLDWLHRTRRSVIDIRDAQRNGPNRLRQKAPITQAFEILQDHGWLKPVSSKRWSVVRERKQ